MSYPVYSTRFVNASGVAGVTSYWVPAGYRAVLKDISAVNPNGHAMDVTVYVHGGIAWTHRFLDGERYRNDAVMLVAYAAEDISVYQPLNDTGVILDGFLLAETGAQLGPPPTTWAPLESYLASMETGPSPR